MSSIVTNYSAINALQALRSQNASLQATQKQASSGLRVEVAADNAAYWSIATTMRSDNKAVSAVSDALGLGAAMVDTAYEAMNSVVDLLGDYKAKLVAAMEKGVDKAKIQTELDQLTAQMKSVADAASFAGQNWLSTDVADVTQNSASVTSAFVRDANGSVRVMTTDLGLKGITLFNVGGGGLLQGAGAASLPGTLGGLAGITANTSTVTYSGPFTLDDDDSIAFDYTYGGTTYHATMTKAIINGWGGISGGTVQSTSDLAYAVAAALNAVGAGYAINIGSTSINLNGNMISNVTSSNGTTSSGTTSLDVDLQSASDTSGFLAATEQAQQSVISAAAKLGSLKSRIDMQANFASDLSDSITSGIGRLVDADMEQVSARLKAEQTSQQLALQSLSIANTGSQNILSLFNA